LIRKTSFDKAKFLRKKVFKIISKIFGGLKNLSYLCTRFDKENIL
jgi:hypothetical protein